MIKKIKMGMKKDPSTKSLTKKIRMSMKKKITMKKVILMMMMMVRSQHQ